MNLNEVLNSWCATTTGQALAKGKINAVELAEASLERAEKRTSTSTMIKVTRTRALSEAQASAMRLKEGRPASPLDGVPMVIKDLIDLTDEVTTAGSSIYKNAPVKKRDASCAANLAARGMVCIGKTNLSEFAFSGLGLNPHYGTPTCPSDKNCNRAPGGSSSGTAIAIARGIVPCGIGTDTGGSVRIPAAFNGLTGYKSSTGRIDKTGVFTLSRTLDTIGPIARTVRDCIHLDAALRGDDRPPITPLSIRGKHILVPSTVVMDNVLTDVIDNFYRSIYRLEKAGAHIRECSFTEFTRIHDLTAKFGPLISAEAYAEHLDLIKSGDLDKIDRRVADRILKGASMQTADISKILQEKEDLTQSVARLIGNALVAMPTTAITAPKIQDLEEDMQYFHETNALVLRNTSLGNFLDLPGLALPNGTDRDGLPTSILISSTPKNDEYLLGCGLSIEPRVRN